MALIDECISVQTRNLGAWDFAVGISVPTGTDLSGSTFSCRYEDPHGNTGNLTANVVESVNVVTIIAQNLLLIAGLWRFWITIDTKDPLGPIGILVKNVP